MDFRIADTFTDSLARLNGDEQKAAKTTAFDLQPESPRTTRRDFRRRAFVARGAYGPPRTQASTFLQMRTVRATGCLNGVTVRMAHPTGEDRRTCQSTAV